MPSTLKQKSVTERRNQTQLEMIRSLIVQANLPISYQRDAFFTTVYIFNQVPSKVVLSTPYELWIDEKPTLSNYDYGVQCDLFTILLISMKKLALKEKNYIFIRYIEYSKRYVLIGKQSDV